MTRTLTTRVDAIVMACGGLTRAVEAVVDLGEILWSLAFPHPGTGQPAWHGKKWPRLLGSPVTVLESLGPQRREFGEAAVAALTDGTLCDGSGFSVNTLRPLVLLRALLGGARHDHDLVYLMMRVLRDRHGCVFAARTLADFEAMASGMRRHTRCDGQLEHTVRGRTRMAGKCAYWEDLVPAIQKSLAGNGGTESSCDARVTTFLAFCRALGYVEATGDTGEVRVWPSSTDAEFLFSSVFGMRTGIPGFDELFGGGLVLADSDSPQPQGLGARAALVMGRCGTGKSTLAQQLAVEVANKGGVAWLMPLEQSQQECVFSMTSLGLLRHADCSFDIILDSGNLMDTLAKKSVDRGLLVILQADKSDYGDFLATMEQNATLLQQVRFRVLVADPINGIVRSEENGSESRRRADTVDALQRIKHAGTNLILVAEEREDFAEDFVLEDCVADVENIADLVVRLSVSAEDYNYSQRYIEVRKSRFQRQHRGRHPFRMRSGLGFEIYPASAAIAARISTRAYRQPDFPVAFGINSLDAILGEKAIARGDVIAFHGPGGSLKTAVGMFFVCGKDRFAGKVQDGEPPTNPPRRTRSLVIAARDSEASVRYLLGRAFVSEHAQAHDGKRSTDIQVCALPKGYIKPGEVFQAVEAEFQRARFEGYAIDRVLVDNLAHWEMSCPFIANDLTFADTLVDFFRRQGVTSLFVCGVEVTSSTGTRGASGIQKPVIDSADCVLRFDRFQYRGVDRTTIRVQKTRAMQHRREAFEIEFSGDSFGIRASSSLLRIVEGEEVKTVKIRLFLHSETHMQVEYHESMKRAIAGVLSRETELESQDRVYMAKAMALGAYSAVDELQILQIDEFQFEDNPTSQRRTGVPLYKFPLTMWQTEEWDDFLTPFKKQIKGADNKTFVGLPYYGNLSFLAYRQTPELTQTVVSSWRDLATLCRHWEKSKENREDPSKLFFEFPRATHENYNTLFFEILLGLGDSSERLGAMGLREWLAHPLAVDACVIMRTLCRRAYFAGGGEDVARTRRVVAGREAVAATRSQDGTEMARSGVDKKEGASSVIAVRKDALVWRHWYSTLNQMLASMAPEESATIAVGLLPGGITTSGEWYLALPVYSAAPDVGLKIISQMTSREAELNRMRLGVGLPTRSSFYKRLADAEVGRTPISPFFSLPVAKVGTLMETAFRRSRFGCYLRVHQVLAHHLMRIIEIPEHDRPEMDTEVRQLLRSATAQMDFVRLGTDCRQCRFKVTCDKGRDQD